MSPTDEPLKPVTVGSSGGFQVRCSCCKLLASVLQMYVRLSKASLPLCSAESLLVYRLASASLP
jgi:hypothetical protein